MTDRELLEAAAKAAGLTIHSGHQAGRDACGAGDVGLRISNLTTCWNPLADDGDALRLAVKLGINIVPNYHAGWHTANGGVGREFTTEAGDSDTYAATRRVIVRAAAAIAGQG